MERGPAIVQQDVEKRRGKGGGASGLQRRMDGCRDFLATATSRLSRLSDWCLFSFL